MSFLKIKELTKTYSNGESPIDVLKNINISFPSSGLVAICGPSGCGKTTLLNCIGLIDTPSSGEIVLEDKNILKFSKKRIDKYHNENVGFIFQNYCLLENETVIFNIALPMMIMGKNKKESYEDAITLLKQISMPSKIYKRKVKNLSGGEKQRVAILRSIINSPNIVLADEPTGALDSKNSIIIMNMLKSISKTKLVIMVSHNDELVEKYADRIISLKDGKIISDSKIKEENNGKHIVEVKRKRRTKWIDDIVRTNLKRRSKRNIGSFLSILVGLTSSILLVGFTLGSKESIQSKKKFHLDYGVATISKDITTEKLDSGLSIVRSFRPEISDLRQVEYLFDNFYVESNYDALLSSNCEIKYKEQNVSGIYVAPVYSFDSDYIDSDYLLNGRIPVDPYNKMLINKNALEQLDDLGFRIGDFLTISSKYSYSYTSDIYETTDYFVFDNEVQITGVVDELPFLSTPKIYYSHSAFDEYLSECILNNLSTKLGRNMTWKEVVALSDNSNEITSYSYRIFAKNSAVDFPNIDTKNTQLSLTSSALVIYDALIKLIETCTLGMELFVGIGIIGTILIMSIISYYSYSEDRLNSAIISSLGGRSDDIASIYTSESLLISFLSYLCSIFLSSLLSLLINYIFSITTGFNNIIKIPWLNLFNKPFIFPLGILLVVILISALSSNIPIWFSKKISIKKEMSFE